MIRCQPATPARWDDLEKLFGPRGACAGCWCMWFRLPRAQWTQGKGAGNRRALKRLVEDGPPPGVLAYDGSEPVGWCAIAPRQEYLRLRTSRVCAPVDDAPVWSVTCFFVARQARGRGVTKALLAAAVKLAHQHGARIVEGYPIDPRGQTYAPTFAYHGLLPAFVKAGFREVARRSPARPIVRRAT